MNRPSLYISLLTAALIAGCSGINNKQAEGGFEYLGHPEGKSLKVPAELDEPDSYDNYKITKNINLEGPVGENMDVRSPALVLPVAASSRVDLKSKKTTIWFDKVFDHKDLPDFIHYALQQQLESDGVTLSSLDDSKLHYQSSWYLKENANDYWLFSSLKSLESMRFNFDYEIKPHRRSMALHVSLVDYMKTDDDGGYDKIAPIDQKRAEVNMLNEVINQVDYEYRLERQKQRLAKASQELVTIGENSGGEPAYIIEMDFDILWDSMPLFFSEYGFKIKDLDETKFIYHVNFSKPETSFWDAIWGNDVDTLDVKDAKYTFKLSRSGKHSAVTIYNEDDEALPRSTLERIFPVMQKGLSFRNLF